MLELAAAAGEICLKYLDESGFSLWSEVVYTWAKIGEARNIPQGLEVERFHFPSKKSI